MFSSRLRQGKFGHLQQVHDALRLARKAAIGIDIKQDMGRLAAVRDKHRLKARQALGFAHILVELAARHGLHSSSSD